MVKKKWKLDHITKTMLSVGIFNPQRVLERKKFFDRQGYETKLKKNTPRKGITELFYREK